MRKLTAFILIFMLVLSTVAVGYAAPKGFTPPGQAKKMVRFDDVADDHWAAETIYQLAESGMLKGYGNGKFMPNKPVTKLESLVMLYEAASGESKDTKTEDYGLYKGPDWGKDYYAWAGRNGAFGDSAKLFNANAAITRAEFAFYAANLEVDDDEFDWDALGNYQNRFDDDEELGEYKEQIRWMHKHRMIIGDEMNMFHGGGALKRSEAAMVMRRLTFFDYGEVSDPWASIDVAEENGCITSLDPEITITFSEYVYENVDGDDDFNKTEAEGVIAFEIYDTEKDDNWDDVEFDITKIERKDSKEIWTIVPEEELSTESAYRIQLDKDDFYDAEGNNLRRDEKETFETCETYSMTADYEAELEFVGDWLEFAIDVDANNDEDKDVEIVFNFEDLPEWFEIQYYDGVWENLTKDGDTYVYPEFELEDETIEFRAYIPTPGAYEIPVEFMTVSPEATLFEFDMEMGRVDLAEDSKGEAGNGVIYNLLTGTAYRVTEIDGEDENVYYTTSDGALVDDMEDTEPLGEDVEMIKGLDNALEYMAEIPLSLEIEGVTESAIGDYEFEFDVTSTPNDDSGVTVLAFYLFDDGVTLDYSNNDDHMYENNITSGTALGPFSLVSATSYFGIDLGTLEEATLTVEFWTADEELMLGRVEYEFEVETE